MTTWSSVDCAEEFVTFSEDYDILAGGNSQVTLRCAWSDRYLLMQDILGSAHPYNPILTAARAACRPFEEKTTTSGQGINYVSALVTFTYSSQVVDIASETLEPFTEMGELDFQRFRWTSGTTGRSLIEGEQAIFMQQCLNIVRTRYRLSSIPAGAISFLNCCNLAAYSSSILGLTFAAETLLYQPQSLSRSFTNIGSQGWTISIKFSYKPHTWNKFWNTLTQSYEYIYLAGSVSAYKPYVPTDISSLLS